MAILAIIAFLPVDNVSQGRDTRETRGNRAARRGGLRPLLADKRSVTTAWPAEPGARAARLRRTGAAVALVAAATCAVAVTGRAQSSDGAAQAGVQRLTIPFLANATKPDDLDFEAAACDMAPGGQQMTCRFRQVFVTVASFDPTACVISTSGYERSFRLETPLRWVSIQAPDGDCGRVETTTLEDGGGTRWTMTIRQAATRNADRNECRAVAGSEEVFSWRGIKRRLPCATIQPGAIER